jgi:hypothetical protein
MKLLSGLLFIVLFLFSCKKGENDSFLSLKSRDARIKGTWILKESTFEEQEMDIFGAEIYKESFNGSTMTISDDGVEMNSYSFSETLEINKEGDYTLSNVEDGESNYVTGSWWWLNDTKKKTRISFDDDIDSYEIDRLTNKELVLIFEYTDSSPYGTERISVIKKYEKKK